MENTHTQVMSVKDWAITLLIAAIPVVGFIMLFVWGFGGNVNINKSNWAKGALILLAILMAFYMLVFMIFGAAFLSNMDSFSDFN